MSGSSGAAYLLLIFPSTHRAALHLFSPCCTQHIKKTNDQQKNKWNWSVTRFLLFTHISLLWSHSHFVSFSRYSNIHLERTITRLLKISRRCIDRDSAIITRRAVFSVIRRFFLLWYRSFQFSSPCCLRASEVKRFIDCIAFGSA